MRAVTAMVSRLETALGVETKQAHNNITLHIHVLAIPLPEHLGLNCTGAFFCIDTWPSQNQSFER